MKYPNRREKKPFQIREIGNEDKPWLIELMKEEWASTRIVTIGKIHRTENLPGFIAIYKKRRVGLIIYNIANEECEIISLNSLKENIGIGTNLLYFLESVAISRSCKRIWLITTNDNIKALRFYQKRGYNIKAIYINSIAHSRKLKPEIPLRGLHNIEIRDEIELEKILEY
ncbi:MAG: GNAT family N-acetyltransferase [Promethearchaeota archaeon]